LNCLYQKCKRLEQDEHILNGNQESHNVLTPFFPMLGNDIFQYMRDLILCAYSLIKTHQSMYTLYVQSELKRMYIFIYKLKNRVRSEFLSFFYFFALFNYRVKLSICAPLRFCFSEKFTQRLLYKYII
jgi:hypothetical protein